MNQSTANAIILTVRDWREIYYALESKKHSPTVAGDAEWIEPLR